MWKNVVYSCAMYYTLVLVITAPVNTLSRGPRYIVNAPSNAQPYVEVKNSTYHGIGPREEARAMCSVKTQEINATANATITRRLHGVVTSRDLSLPSVITAMLGDDESRTAMVSFCEAVMSQNLETRELHSAIQRLEVIIYGQMQQLWQSLDALRAQMTSVRATYPDRRSVSFRYKPNVY